MLEGTIAGQIDAVTLSCLETGAFQLKLRVKSAFVDRSPPAVPVLKTSRERGETQRLRGLFPQPKYVRRMYLGRCASECVCCESGSSPSAVKIVCLFVWAAVIPEPDPICESH